MQLPDSFEGGTTCSAEDRIHICLLQSSVPFPNTCPSPPAPRNLLTRSKHTAAMGWRGTSWIESELRKMHLRLHGCAVNNLSAGCWWWYLIGPPHPCVSYKPPPLVSHHPGYFHSPVPFSSHSHRIISRGGRLSATRHNRRCPSHYHSQTRQTVIHSNG